MLDRKSFNKLRIELKLIHKDQAVIQNKFKKAHTPLNLFKVPQNDDLIRLIRKKFKN